MYCYILKSYFWRYKNNNRDYVGFEKNYLKKSWKVSKKSLDLYFSQFLVKMIATKISVTLD